MLTNLFLAYFCCCLIWYRVQCLETRNFRFSNVLIDNDNVAIITDSPKISFSIIGDWGGLPIWPYRTLIEANIAKKMDELGKMYNTQFQLALGDNFYFTGVNDASDKRFKETYEKVFDSEHLRNSPWFPILGNHDHYGNPYAQVEYSQISKRWIMPALSYTIDVKIHNGQQTLMTLIMLDTIILCGNVLFWDSLSQPRYANMDSQDESDAQWIELDRLLFRVNATRVPYIVVAGHFPVWSVGSHGPTKCLVEKLRPLLLKYNVALYLSGHEHNLQHLREYDAPTNRTVDYVVSGCSSLNDMSRAHEHDLPSSVSLKMFWYHWSIVFNGGFVVAQADADSMNLSFHSTSGKSVYMTTIKPRF